MKTGLSEYIEKQNEKQRAEKREKIKKEYDTKKRIIKELNRSKKEKKKLRERAKTVYEEKKKELQKQRNIIKKSSPKRVNLKIKGGKRKKQTKRQKTAKKIQQIQKKAREKIREMESVGFTVPAPYKELANKKITPSQKNLEEMRKLLNVTQVKKAGYLLIDTIRSGSHPQGLMLENPVRGIDYSVLTDKKRLAKKLNDMKSVRVPKRAPSDGEGADKYFGHVKSAQEGSDIANIVLAIGEEVKQGNDNQYFTIDDTWDGQLYTLSEHITWKEVPVEKFWQEDQGDKYNDVIDYILRYMGLAYTDRELYDEFRKTSDAKRFEKWAKEYLNDNDNDYDFEEMETLEYILSSSHIWNIASKFYKYEDAKDIHDEIVGITIEASRTTNDILAEIVAMIRAEKRLKDIKARFEELTKDWYKEATK